MKEESIPPCPINHHVVGKYSDLSSLEVADGAIVYVASEEKLVLKRSKTWTFVQVRNQLHNRVQTNYQLRYHCLTQLFILCK